MTFMLPECTLRGWDGLIDSVGDNLSSTESTQEVEDQLLCSSKKGNKSLSLIQWKWIEVPRVC